MLTEKQQKLIIKMFNSKGSITRSEQNIYTSHSFYDKMSQLRELGLIHSKKLKSNNGHLRGFKPCKYMLTIRGETLARIILGATWL